MMTLYSLLSRCVALTAGVALVLAFTASAAAQQAKDAAAQKPKDGPGNCQRCHASGLPLPEKHPKITGASIAECVSCHASQAGQAKPHPVASRLHRQHIKVGLDCTTCHAYSPGKRFAVMGHEGNLGALDAEQYEWVRKAMVTWASSPWLACIHGTKQNLS